MTETLAKMADTLPHGLISDITDVDRVFKSARITNLVLEPECQWNTLEQQSSTATPTNPQNTTRTTKMATMTVLYPSGGTFNMPYYLSTHMPLAEKHWKPYGAKSWKVVKLGDDAPYAVQATIEWGSMEQFLKAAQGPEIKEIQGDVKNFSDKEPVVVFGEVVGKSEG
ncbi:hypothetical protein PRZ48_011628 [Zasmidium cellare]|uniref:EthD domain-containing protein n=1 Tax=Zasmidium cellare TaxID=395010 RepID=A0ABR0E6W8_ZASCE|nr:hypothetical protein PRZ48_011628 [Zasmidium cellare]